MAGLIASQFLLLTHFQVAHVTGNGCLEPGSPAPPDGGNGAELPAWCNVYEGLTDEQIVDIERSIVRTRASRTFDWLMDIALLDTDTLSELLKQRNPNVKRRATQCSRSHGQFAFSGFTRFELDRGYRESGASTQRVRFVTFCQHSLVLPVTTAVFAVVFDRAADLWVVVEAIRTATRI